MNKKEFIEKVAAKGHTQKDVREFLEDILETIVEVLEDGDTVHLQNFGTFQSVDTVCRMGRNPRTKEEFEIPASKKPKFKPGAEFKRRVIKK